MEKTKIGLSFPVAAAASFLLFTLCGTTVGFLFLGYILLCETDAGLKRKALSAAIIYVGFLLFGKLFSLILDAFGIIDHLVTLAKGRFDVDIIGAIANLLNYTVYFVRDVLMLVLAFRAWKGKDVELDFVKKILD